LPRFKKKINNAKRNDQSWRRTKNQRCVLWFRFTGHPTTTTPASASVVGRRHAIRVEQQPLGGTPALVFAADLHTGGERRRSLQHSQKK